jgi:hypothetical protein
MNYCKKEGYNTIFKHVFVSSNMGVVKPQAGFYEQILAKIGMLRQNRYYLLMTANATSTEQIAAGMQGHTYTRLAGLKQVIDSL